MPSDQPLRDHAKALKKAAKPEFDKFLQVFEQYTVAVALNVAACPPEQLPAYQGRIQQCNALLELFHKCDREPTKPAP